MTVQAEEGAVGKSAKTEVFRYGLGIHADAFGQLRLCPAEILAAFSDVRGSSSLLSIFFIHH